VTGLNVELSVLEWLKPSELALIALFLCQQRKCCSIPADIFPSQCYGKEEREMVPQIKKILYATDLSKNSSYAFLYATDMAKRHDAKIVILHAIESYPAYIDAYAGTAVVIEQKEQGEVIEEIKGHLQEFCRKAEAQIGPPCVSLVSKILVPRGHPPEEILNAADEEGCDVIVLGTHGKGFLAHAFLGSVSSAVLHRTRKPVFIIPLPSEKASIHWNGI
jgi:nucleotide-binding universal stress UspA family protein